MDLKATNFAHTIGISSIRYVFIIYLEINHMLQY